MPSPLIPGSVSLGLHTDAGLTATHQVDALLAQAVAAEEAGFDGVTLSEHHDGFPGYMPQPLLAATWILERTERVWSGPLPLLAGPRNPMLLLEQLAWTSARHPGRLVAGLAAGYARSDFDFLEADYERRGARLGSALLTLAAPPLTLDRAIAAFTAVPPPLLAATATNRGVLRAAALQLGVVFPEGGDADAQGELVAAYREAGGAGPVVRIRSVWLGEPPAGAAVRREETYKKAAAAGSALSGGFAEPFLHGEPGAVATALRDELARSGVSALNLRVHLPGVAPEEIEDQIGRAGAELLPELRAFADATAEAWA
jgi:alkanesulfonate monooxygenase SsuD/methylene tetrahydromethanopterin reductase-like flavin-dependent oxidoreductase (luciferase family)